MHTHTRYLPTLIHIDIYTYTWMASKIDKKLALIAADPEKSKSITAVHATSMHARKTFIYKCDKNRSWNF